MTAVSPSLPILSIKRVVARAVRSWLRDSGSCAGWSRADRDYADVRRPGTDQADGTVYKTKGPQVGHKFQEICCCYALTRKHACDRPRPGASVGRGW